MFTTTLSWFLWTTKFYTFLLYKPCIFPLASIPSLFSLTIPKILVPIQQVRYFRTPSMSKFVTFKEYWTSAIMSLCSQKPKMPMTKPCKRCSRSFQMSGWCWTSQMLNKSKCEFNKHSLAFFGFVFSAEGISPNPKKVQAIHNASPPTPASGVRSFLGMATYCARFIPKM